MRKIRLQNWHSGRVIEREVFDNGDFCLDNESLASQRLGCINRFWRLVSPEEDLEVGLLPSSHSSKYTFFFVREYPNRHQYQSVEELLGGVRAIAQMHQEKVTAKLF